MDYEKKYNEALERVRRLHDRMLVLSSTDALVASSELEFIFPELTESEDERIKKIIYNCVYECCDTGYLLKDDRNSVVAWLEKQKEQKPAECIEDSLKFEEGFKAGRESGLLDGQKYVLNNLDSYGLCKPAEWSEEDKEKIVTISEIIEHCTTIPYSGGTLTLNKEYKKELLCFIKSLRPQYHGDVTMTEAYKMGLEAGKASSWKPSEHQMTILKAVKDYVGKGSGYWGEALSSLIEDLKKL